MPIALGGSTLNNGGTVNFAGNTSVKEVQFGGTTVWKKEEIYERTASVEFPFYPAEGPVSAGSTNEVVLSLPVGSAVTFNTITHVAGGATYQRFYIFLNNGATYVWGQSYNSGQNTCQLYALSAKEGGWDYSTSNSGPYTITTTTRSVVIGIQGGANAGAWQYGPGASHSESVYTKFTVT